MRRPITFPSQGLNCTGWLYVPDPLSDGKKAPAIVMANAFSAVKEMYYANYAEPLARAGFVALSFDYRHYGESEGEPRSQLFPQEQLDDLRNAITWLADQPEVDADRIGAWGMCLGGGHVLALA